MSSHSVQRDAGGWKTRSFVHVSGELPAAIEWSLLAPRTYDHTRIADAPDFDFAMTFTLVGPASARVVESRARWFLDPAWQGRRTAALEVDAAGSSVVALAGKHADARWSELVAGKSVTADVAWVRAQGASVSGREAIAVTRVPGTEHELVTAYGKTTTTFVRVRGDLLVQFEGIANGVLTVGGQRLLVVHHDGRISTVTL